LYDGFADHPILEFHDRRAGFHTVGVVLLAYLPIFCFDTLMVGLEGQPP